MHGGNTTVETRMLQEEEGKKDLMKRRRENGDMTVFFSAVNNTFLQFSRLKKHKCERDYRTRNREKEENKNKIKDGHRCACTFQGDSPK